MRRIQRQPWVTPLQHFPVYLRLTGERVVVAGAGEAAVAKLRLLRKTEAVLSVFGAGAAAEIRAWHRQGALRHEPRPVRASDVAGAALLYAAGEDAAADRRVAALGRRLGVPVNVVDNLAASDFITPAIIDRDPVTVAIGTEGAAPVLARTLKAEFEARLPSSLGALARIAGAGRPAAAGLPAGRARRQFWSSFFRHAPAAHARGGEPAAAALVDDLLAAHGRSGRAPLPGSVSLVGAGPGDPELLTLRARRRLHDADLVLFDAEVAPAILELARREAAQVCVGRAGSTRAAPEALPARLVAEARAGLHVVRLVAGDPAAADGLQAEIDALEAADIAWETVPGIPAPEPARIWPGGTAGRWRSPAGPAATRFGEIPPPARAPAAAVPRARIGAG